MSASRAFSQARSLQRGLIVSCQADDNSVLNRPEIISAMAQMAERQGAVGVRINGVRNIKAARRKVSVPIIGIEKLRLAGSGVYITPTFESVRRVQGAGADIIALDATGRRRPGSQCLEEIIREAKRRFGAVIMADVATLDEALRAADVGADLVATTLYGYSSSARSRKGPAFDLVRDASCHLSIPVVLEGHVRQPAEVSKAFDFGAYAVVVGKAITDIEWLVGRFAAAVPKRGKAREPAPDTQPCIYRSQGLR